MIEPVVLMPKAKYMHGGKGQLGYKPPSGGGDSTKHRVSYHKASDKEKARISASQVKMARVHFGRSCAKSRFMPYEEVEAFLEKQCGDVH